MEAVEGEVSSEDAHKQTLVKQAKLWVVIDGICHRITTLVKHLASLTTAMEQSEHRGPRDYPYPPGISVRYEDGGGRGPTPRDTSWQNWLTNIMALLIVSGIPTILAILWSMNSRLTSLESSRNGDTKLLIQRLDAQDKHLESHDRRLDELDREVWHHGN